MSVFFCIAVIVGFVCVHLLQVVEEGEEVATRMTVVIGILGVGGATMAVVTGTMTEGLVEGQRVALVAIRPKMEVTVVNRVVAMATVTTVTDRVVLVLQETSRAPLVTKVSRGPLSLVACRELLRMA